MEHNKRDTVIPLSQQTLLPTRRMAIEIGIAGGALLLATLVYVCSFVSLGLKSPDLPTPTDRLLYVIKLQVFPASTLAISLIHVMICRFWYPAARNPLSGHEYYVEKAARILQSTVEHLLLYLLNVLIFALLVSDRLTFLIPFVVFCFTFGRCAFLVGYLIHPLHKELGFVFTFAPVMIMLAYNLLKTFGCENVDAILELIL